MWAELIYNLISVSSWLNFDAVFERKAAARVIDVKQRMSRNSSKSREALQKENAFLYSRSLSLT